MMNIPNCMVTSGKNQDQLIFYESKKLSTRFKRSLSKKYLTTCLNLSHGSLRMLISKALSSLILCCKKLNLVKAILCTYTVLQQSHFYAQYNSYAHQHSLSRWIKYSLCIIKSSLYTDRAMREHPSGNKKWIWVNPHYV